MYWLSRLRNRFDSHWFWPIISCIFLFAFFLYQQFIGIELFWNADLAILAVGIMAIAQSFADFRFLDKFKKPLCLLLVILWLVSSWINFHFWGTVDWYYSSFANPLLFLLAALSGTLVICVISKAIVFPNLTSLGRNSLFFFGFHRIIIDLSFALYNKIGLNVETGTWQAIPFAFVSVALAILVLIPLNWFTLKFFPWCMGKKGRHA